MFICHLSIHTKQCYHWTRLVECPIYLPQKQIICLRVWRWPLFSSMFHHAFMDLCPQHCYNWMTKRHHHALINCRWPETPQNVGKKPPDPEKAEICPETPFPQEKINTGRRPVQNRFFRVFELRSRNVAKTAIVAYFGNHLVQKRATVAFFQLWASQTLQ